MIHPNAAIVFSSYSPVVVEATRYFHGLCLDYHAYTYYGQTDDLPMHWFLWGVRKDHVAPEFRYRAGSIWYNANIPLTPSSVFGQLTRSSIPAPPQGRTGVYYNLYIASLLPSVYMYYVPSKDNSLLPEGTCGIYLPSLFAVIRVYVAFRHVIGWRCIRHGETVIGTQRTLNRLAYVKDDYVGDHPLYSDLAVQAADALMVDYGAIDIAVPIDETAQAVVIGYTPAPICSHQVAKGFVQRFQSCVVSL